MPRRSLHHRAPEIGATRPSLSSGSRLVAEFRLTDPMGDPECARKATSPAQSPQRKRQRPVQAVCEAAAHREGYLTPPYPGVLRRLGSRQRFAGTSPVSSWPSRPGWPVLAEPRITLRGSPLRRPLVVSRNAPLTRARSPQPLAASAGSHDASVHVPEGLDEPSWWQARLASSHAHLLFYVPTPSRC